MGANSRMFLLHCTCDITIKYQMNISPGSQVQKQGCALAEPGGPWRLTFVPGRLENLIFFIQIIRWAP